MLCKFSFRCVLAVASNRGGAIMDNQKMFDFYISVRNSQFIAKKAIIEIEQSTDEANKSDRLAGVLDFLTRMLDADIEKVQA
jgi:hypothetical protein